MDLNTDQQNSGLASSVYIDRDSASRLGLTAQNSMTRFMMLSASDRSPPCICRSISIMWSWKWRRNSGRTRRFCARCMRLRRPGKQVPFAAFAKWTQTTTPLVVNHQGQFPSVTLSFNLPLGVSLEGGCRRHSPGDDGIPSPCDHPGQLLRNGAGISGFALQRTGADPAALIAVYIVLGILYESYIHPITILSTLPSAGVGALLALLICHTDLSVIALIGIILLIGIVKKNAIMMIDFALEAERKEAQNLRKKYFRSLPPAFPAHYDDDHGGAVGRAAARVRDRHRIGAAEAAGHCHRGWADCEPDADAFYDSGRLPIHGPFAERAAADVFAAACGGASALGLNTL